VHRQLAAAAALILSAVACTPGQLSASASDSPLGVPSQTAVATETTAAATQTAAATTAAATTAAPSPTPTDTPTQAPTQAPATPAPTPQPTVAPTPQPTVAPTPQPTVAPTPAPTPTPQPSSAGVPGGLAPATGPVPPNFSRYGGHVVDASTNLPISGVCIYSGPPAGCPQNGTMRSDATGYFAIDYPAGIQFTWTFEHPSYKGLLNQTITGTNQTFKLTHN
jgi:hypothetical protein